MYMRYHPKQLKPINRLEKVPKQQRGKKHFWGHERGDYGIYQTQDIMEMKKIRNDCMTNRQHQRGYSSDINNSFVYQRNHTEPTLTHNPQSPQKPYQTKRKSVLQICHPTQIHLPAIPKTSKQIQTVQQPHSRLQQLKLQNKPKAKHTTSLLQQQPKYTTQMRNTRHRRYRTEITQDFIRSISPSKIRFSPTFVCSIQNPMPSYMLSPQLYNSPTYIRAQNDYNDKQYKVY